jgi:DNA-binding transcriptional ArsR family regulator
VYDSVTFSLLNSDALMPPTRAVTDPFHAVSDPTRRALLDRLRLGAAPVTELAAGFDMSRPAVSRHLRVLREARLVRERRSEHDARLRVYQITPMPLRDVLQWAQSYELFWHGGLARLKAHVEKGARTRAREKKL